MSKKIDLNRTVFELVEEYPELIDIMAKLGFYEITSKPVLHSVGRIMTIPKGARMKNISMIDVVTTLMSNGFELVGEMPAIKQPASTSQPQPASSAPARTEQLKSYLRRLGAGEDLERVRADFVREFEQVDATEIMQAEQELMLEGTPLSEVQKLCDIHSALFHGATRQERIVSQIATQIATQNGGADAVQSTGASELAAIPGHPLHTLTRENQALSALLEAFRSTQDSALLPTIRELSLHYAKKGDLIYPLLNVNYGISGPSDVMWTVDDEIRDKLGALLKRSERGEKWAQQLDAVLKRAEEMIYKEQSILFPICAAHFTAEEWKGIYRDANYAPCFGVAAERWDDAEVAAPVAPAFDGEIVMPGGHMTVEQLTAVLNTIPLEITFVDADNINRYFNEGPKVFKRPSMAIDREVFSCHPPKIEPMVRQIIDDFRSGKRNDVSVWMEKGGCTMLVKYMAVRDAAGKYIGTLELVQDMEFVKEHFKING